MSKEYSVFPLIFSQDNVVSGTNNSLYQFNFSRNIELPKGSKVAVGKINLYYSWFNILSSLQNNEFQITWPTGASENTYTITLPDGNYSIDDINSYIQSYCIANSLYLIDSNGDYVYYLNLAVNTTYYSVQLTTFPVPTSLPSGYTAPPSFPAYPTTTRVPQLIVPSSNNFGDVIGFNSGTYPNPTQITTYSKLSDNTPQVSSVDTVILTCNLLNNQFDISPKNLYSFSSAGNSFGQLIQTAPNFEQYVEVNSGSYNNIQLQFITPNNQPLALRDSNVVIELLIKVPNSFAY